MKLEEVRESSERWSRSGCGGLSAKVSLIASCGYLGCYCLTGYSPDGAALVLHIALADVELRAGELHD